MRYLTGVMILMAALCAHAADNAAPATPVAPTPAKKAAPAAAEKTAPAAKKKTAPAPAKKTTPPPAKKATPVAAKETMQAPEKGLAQVLGKAGSGMPFADFLAEHPDALYSDTDMQEERPTPDEPGGLLLEWDKDPWLGLECIADIGFKDGKLYEFVVMWKGPAEPVAAAKEAFFKECLRRNSKTFTREALQLHPGSNTEELVPVFSWEANDALLLAYYTPPVSGAPSNKAVFTYACFRKGDATVSAMLCGALLDDAKRAELWRDLEPLIQAAK